MSTPEKKSVEDNTPDTCEGCEHNKIHPNEDVTHTCTPPDTEWEKEDRELAHEAFDILGKFFMKNCNRVPPSMLEACDYVSNYLGDIAMGREITIEKPEDAFPSLLTSRDTYWKEQLQKAEQRGEERMKRAQEQTDEYYRLRCEKELQKARIDFLRSEIEKLEDNLRIADEIPDTLSDIWQQAHNKALTSIITRYKEELKVLESNV